MKKILVIFFGKYMQRFLAEKPALDMSFFADEKWWPVRPNSTNRLLLANYQALEKLSSFFDFDFVSLDSVEDLEPFFLKSYDFLLVNQVANLQCIKTLVSLIALFKEEGLLRSVIFGTELTWASEVMKGNISDSELKAAYVESKILRHTAKTDRFIYKSGGLYQKCNIREFEIGLDTEVVSSKMNILDRKKITFVLAPEGRATKNNDGAKEIINLIKSAPELNGYEVELVSPPYSTPKLWGIYDESAFLIFTSIGETFSYVLNDAKSKGVITLYNKVMYNNVIPGEFCVQSYPGSGIKYGNAEEALAIIKNLVADDKRLIAESNKSRDYVRRFFSIDSIAKNWFDLFLGRSELVNKSVVYKDAGGFRSYEDFVFYLKLNDIGFVYLLGDSAVVPRFADFSYYDDLNDIVYSKDARVSQAFRDGDADVLLRYFCLYKRIYKIKDVFVLTHPKNGIIPFDFSHIDRW